MKRSGIVIVLFLLVNHVYTQVDRQLPGLSKALNSQDSIIFIYGKIEVFPPDSLDRMKEMTASARFGGSTKYKALTLQSNGDFYLRANKSELNRILIFIKGIHFSQKGAYYPIEIKNVNLSQDTLYLGIIPAMPDPFGYYAESGNTMKNHIFDRKRYFYTSEVMFMDKRLKYEDTLNNIYNSFCYDCDSIFITKVVSWSKKRHFSTEESRKLTISHRDLLSMSEYFSFNYPHLDSLASGFVNFMKRLPDSTFWDRFNKAVSNYSFPAHYNTPDSVSIYYYGQIIKYKEDSTPVIFNHTHPELDKRLYYGFRNEVLKVVELTKEEKSSINNELLFYLEVDRIGNIKELKLLSLVNSDTRHRLETLLTWYSDIRWSPIRARGRAYGFKAALYIDL